MAPAERDAISPNGFIAWLRQHSSRERGPYILAVSDRETSETTPTPNRAWDELLLMPIDDRKLQSRLESIQSWVENRLADIQKNAPQLNPQTTRVAIRPLTPPPKPQTPKLKVPPPPLRPKKIVTPDLVDPAQLVKQPKLKRELPPPPKAPTSAQPTTAPPTVGQQLPESETKEDAIFEPAPFQPLDQATQLQALIDNAPIGMALFDRDMRYLALNRRWLADFGLVGADLVGRSHLDVFPNLGPAWRRVYARALQGHPERCEEDLWVRQDGSQDWVRWEVRPWIGDDGAVAGITMTCEVINRLVEHHAKDHNTTVGRSLLHGKVTPVVSIDLEGQIESISEACLAYIPGGDEAAIEGELFWEVFSLDPGRDKLKHDFLIAARDTREGERFAFPPSWSHPARLATGGRTVLVWANSPCYDTDGRVCGVLCIGITQSELAAPPVMRKPIETEPKPLPKAEMETTKVMSARPEQLLEQASFGIILLDRERNTLYANPEHSRLLGHDVRDFADIEEWLAQAVPESSNGVLVLESWRENVWQKQVTKTLTLRNREKALRQIEFRPRPTADGGLMLTLFDVTEKRRSEEALRASEAKFRALFQHAGVGIALEDRSGNFFDVNPLFERMVDAQRHEIRKTRVRDWIHADDWPEVMNYLEDQKSGSAAAGSIEVRLNQKSGAMLWSRTTISRIVDHNGRSIFTAYFFHDITNERKVDATLRAAQEEHRALLGAIPDLILMLDRGGRIVDLSPAAAGSLIADSSQAIGNPLAALIPGFEDRVPQLIERAATKDPVSVVKFRDEASDRFYKARFVRCSDDRFVCVIQDETTGQRANDAMQRHALTFDHNCEGIVITDLTGKITDYNDAAERIFGYARPEIIGHTLSTL
ncbi:MAG: PAS domain S-box protein, partial [Verrucomicrobiota bacterium]